MTTPIRRRLPHAFPALLLLALVMPAVGCVQKHPDAASLSAEIEGAVQKVDANAVQSFRVVDGRLNVADVTNLAAKPAHSNAIVCHAPLSTPIPFARCVGAWFTTNPNGCLQVWQDHGLGKWCAADNC